MNNIEINGQLFRENNGTLDALILSGENLYMELRALEKYNVSGIVLNRHFCAGRINDLTFLKDYPNLKKVLVCNDDFRLDGLYCLHELEELVVCGKDTLDYSQFPKLKVLDTRQPGPYMFPDGLQTLYIWYLKLKGKGLCSINFPKALTSLSINWSDIDNLVGLPSGLTHFGIAYTRKLSSLNGLENSSESLQELCIENCPRLREYSSLSLCESINKLLICRCREIPDISFVNKMKLLRHFAFPGTDVQSHDLAPLKGVKSVYFDNKKEYNYKLSDFE